MSNALRAQGTQIQHGIATVFSSVEECNDIKIGGISISSIDVTHLQSTAKEFIPGLADNGTVDIMANFINGTVQKCHPRR